MSRRRMMMAKRKKMIGIHFNKWYPIDHQRRAIINANDEIEVSFKYEGSGWVCGSRIGSATNTYAVGLGGAVIRYGVPQFETPFPLNDGVMHVVRFGKNRVIIDGVEYKRSGVTCTAYNDILYIFGVNESSYYADADIYYVKVYNADGSVKYDFQPFESYTLKGFYGLICSITGYNNTPEVGVKPVYEYN